MVILKENDHVRICKQGDVVVKYALSTQAKDDLAREWERYLVYQGYDGVPRVYAYDTSCLTIEYIPYSTGLTLAADAVCSFVQTFPYRYEGVVNITEWVWICEQDLCSRVRTILDGALTMTFDVCVQAVFSYVARGFSYQSYTIHGDLSCDNLLITDSKRIVCIDPKPVHCHRIYDLIYYALMVNDQDLLAHAMQSVSYDIAHCMALLATLRKIHVFCHGGHHHRIGSLLRLIHHRL